MRVHLPQGTPLVQRTHSLSGSHPSCPSSGCAHVMTQAGRGGTRPPSLSHTRARAQTHTRAHAGQPILVRPESLPSQAHAPATVCSAARHSNLMAAVPGFDDVPVCYKVLRTGSQSRLLHLAREGAGALTNSQRQGHPRHPHPRRRPEHRRVSRAWVSASGTGQARATSAGPPPFGHLRMLWCISLFPDQFYCPPQVSHCSHFGAFASRTLGIFPRVPCTHTYGDTCVYMQ